VEHKDIEVWVAKEEAATAIQSTTQVYEAELYDLGALHHMSPFHAKFTMYPKIAPRPIVAADKRVFYVVGVGDLAIQVPHGKSSTPIILKETLHTPDIPVTIVSVN
jgi:hypothetical protein